MSLRAIRTIILSGILSVVPMKAVGGITTSIQHQNTVNLGITRTWIQSGIIHGHLHLRVGTSVFNCTTVENEDYAIPDGSYITTLEQSKRFQRRVPMLQVPGRTYIEIHPSGKPLGLKGCIGVSAENFETLIKLLPPQQSFVVVVTSA